MWHWLLYSKVLSNIQEFIPELSNYSERRLKSGEIFSEDLSWLNRKDIKY